LDSFKQVQTTQTPKEQWGLNSHFKILIQNSQEHEFSILPQNDRWKRRSEGKDHVSQDGLKIEPLDLRGSRFFYEKPWEKMINSSPFPFFFFLSRSLCLKIGIIASFLFMWDVPHLYVATRFGAQVWGANAPHICFYFIFYFYFLFSFPILFFNFFFSIIFIS